MQLNKENRRINEKLCSVIAYNSCKSGEDDYSYAVKFDLLSNRRWQKRNNAALQPLHGVWHEPSLLQIWRQSLVIANLPSVREGKVPSVTSCFYSISAVLQKQPSFFHISVWGENGVAQSKRTKDARREAAGLKRGQREGWDTKEKCRATLCCQDWAGQQRHMTRLKEEQLLPKIANKSSHVSSHDITWHHQQPATKCFFHARNLCSFPS